MSESGILAPGTKVIAAYRGVGRGFAWQDTVRKQYKNGNVVLEGHDGQFHIGGNPGPAGRALGICELCIVTPEILQRVHEQDVRRRLHSLTYRGDWSERLDLRRAEAILSLLTEDHAEEAAS